MDFDVVGTNDFDDSSCIIFWNFRVLHLFLMRLYLLHRFA